MNKIPFDEKELEILGERPSALDWMQPTPIYNRPITNKENMRLLYRDRTPLWMPQYFNDTIDFSPSVVPDNIARGFVFGSEDFDNEKLGGGPDMYGTTWVYEPSVGGSMVKPGNPRLRDMNDWRSVVTLPDVDSWDWEGSAKANEAHLKSDQWIVFTLLTGYFERLISLMDFEGAAMALIDEDQEEAIHDFFTVNTQILCKIVDKVAEYFPQVDCIVVHDDWGSQRSPFFSMNTAMQMIVPYMKQLVDHIHSKGLYADLHSCGHTEERVEAFIAAGWDSWCPQPMNDSAALFENYGDKIIIIPSDDGHEGMTREEIVEMAKDLAHRYARPGKCGMVCTFEGGVELEKEIYRYSRYELMK